MSAQLSPGFALHLEECSRRFSAQRQERNLQSVQVGGVQQAEVPLWRSLVFVDSATTLVLLFHHEIFVLFSFFSLTSVTCWKHHRRTHSLTVDPPDNLLLHSHMGSLDIIQSLNIKHDTLYRHLHSYKQALQTMSGDQSESSLRSNWMKNKPETEMLKAALFNRFYCHHDFSECA